MSINIVPATPENLEKMKGNKFVPHDGEGVVCIKLVMIKPSTIEQGDPAKLVGEAPEVILFGQLTEIKDQIGVWFDERAAEYKEIE